MNLDKLLKKNSKYDALLLAGLTSNLFYSMSYPIVHTICIKDLSSNLLSFTSLLSCILAIILSQAWLKYSDKLYKTFGISLLLEGIKEVIDELRKDYHIVVVSSRCKTKEGITAIINYLRKYNIIVDEVMKEKPPALIYIDDRAICFDGNSKNLLNQINNFKTWQEKLK